MIKEIFSLRGIDLRCISFPTCVKINRYGFIVIMYFLPLLISGDYLNVYCSDLILASNGKSDYQIIVPVENPDKQVSEWINRSAQLIQEAFKSNGFILSINSENKSDPSKPGIYLSDTKFARSNGVNVSKLSDWGYIHKVVGKNLIIAGPDKPVPTDPVTKFDVSVGTVKGVCDFLKEYAGTYFLYPGNTGIEFLKTLTISVPATLNELNTPSIIFNYSLNWNTGFYEIANNMFPPANLSKDIINQITVKNKKLFEEGKFFKVLDNHIAFTYNWGSYHSVAYTPKKTPRYVGAQVKNILSNKNITGIIKDGFGECFGLEGPVYYVSGRLLDYRDTISAKVITDLLSEFYQAAFLESAAPMQRFYNEIYHNLELYSEWMGVGGAAEYFHTKDRGKIRYINNPLHFLSYLYSPKLISVLETELNNAKKLAVSPKVKQRLELVSMEFDYLKNMMIVIHLYNSYNIQPDDVSWKSLLASIGAWNTKIDSYYDSEGKMKPLPGWPELIPFKGDPKLKVGLKTDDYLAKFSQTPFTWDIKTIKQKTNN